MNWTPANSLTLRVTVVRGKSDRSPKPTSWYDKEPPLAPSTPHLQTQHSTPGKGMNDLNRVIICVNLQQQKLSLYIGWRVYVFLDVITKAATVPGATHSPANSTRAAEPQTTPTGLIAGIKKVTRCVEQRNLIY